MKKLKYIIVLIIFISNFQNLIADEGMWVVSLIGKNYEQMKKLGLKLSADDIYNINHASIKDAVIQFGRGCTGEIVSDEGLIFTNHHCGFSYIQKHSTVEHNYLADGFWAMDKSQELTNPGLTARFLIRIEDVTNDVIKKLDKTLTEEQRNIKLQEIYKEIIKNRVKNQDYTGDVKPIFEGNQFILYVYEIYKDVRLVGAPPSSIGKFGGDTDNWMWPRHTADFSVFRVYSAPNGKPAEYSKNNIPLKPKYVLPVSKNRLNEGEFAMIIGYPGRTNRYKSSFGVKQAFEDINPAIIKIRTKKLELLKEDMDNNLEIKIKYSTKYAHSSNYWKYFIGQNKGIQRLNVIGKKQDKENEFQNWVNQDSDRKNKYGTLLSDIKKTYDDLKNYNLVKVYYSEAAIRGSDGIYLAYKFLNLYKILDNDIVNQDDYNNEVERVKKYSHEYFRDFNLSTDIKVTSALLQIYYNDIASEYHPTIFSTIEKKYKKNFTKYYTSAYKNSIFKSEENLDKFLEKPTLKTLSNDPIFKLMHSIYGSYSKFRIMNHLTIDLQNKLKRNYMQGLMDMEKSKNFYPDANLTMRLTYGNVKSYIPKDAVSYDYYTTLKGVMEKEDPDNDEFIVPEKLKELYKSKDYGDYAQDGKLMTCFLTNNDITGGNSGSPVINGKGELIGIAFDGDWEAMSGDIAFEPNLQRTIVVDVRYVLFIIDKFAGAKNLINEIKYAPKQKYQKPLPTRDMNFEEGNKIH